MKKITPLDELNLTKEIIASLSPEQLREIEGGAAFTNNSQISCFAESCLITDIQQEGN